jgi:hypothetical protein
MSHIRKEGHGKKLRRRWHGKIEIGGEAWLLNDPVKVEMSQDEEETIVVKFKNANIQFQSEFTVRLERDRDPHGSTSTQRAFVSFQIMYNQLCFLE